MNRRKGEKTVLLWLMSGSPLVTQTMFVPSNTSFDLGWSCFVLFFLSLVLSPLIFPVVFAAG